MMANVLRATWGHGWLLQAASALVAFAGFCTARRGARGAWLVAATGAVTATISPAFMGHAVAEKRVLAVSLVADWLHVTAAGAWVGTVALLARIVASADENAAARASTATLIETFHPVALASAATILITGVASLLLRVDHPRDLLLSSYGAILGAKLALAVGVAGFGWRHARHGAALARAQGGRVLARSLMAEAALAAAVIAATAVLVGTAPPMDVDMPTHPLTETGP